MNEGTAQTTLTIYNPVDRIAIVQVEVGQRYATPWEVWEGTIEYFLTLNPDHRSIDYIENEETI